MPCFGSLLSDWNQWVGGTEAARGLDKMSQVRPPDLENREMWTPYLLVMRGGPLAHLQPPIDSVMRLGTEPTA